MIAAGEPRVFYPNGRVFLALHPGDACLAENEAPVIPTNCGMDFSQDLLTALQGVSITDQSEREGWSLQEDTEEGTEEEFYFNKKTVVWSKCTAGGSYKVIKCMTVENIVLQVLWTDFNVLCTKPRRAEPVPECSESKRKREVISALCVIQPISMNVFTNSGDDYLVAIPFQVLRSWSTKFGLLFERNANECSTDQGSNPDDKGPLIFSMLHPLDDISPVIRKMDSKLSFFCSISESIIYSCCNPPFLVTFNKNDGTHTVWYVRTTTYEEADVACSITLGDSRLQETPDRHSSHSSSSKFTHLSRTPSSPFRSRVSSRIPSPANYSFSMSPSSSSLTHMATLSRTCSNSTSAASKRYTFSPIPMNVTHRSPLPGFNAAVESEFMDPLVPDLCFEHVWTEHNGSGSHGQAASKVFLCKDCAGLSFMCFVLKTRHQLKIIKLEETNSKDQWIFGTENCIPGIDAEPLPALNLIIVLECNLSLSLYSGLTKVTKVYISEPFTPFGEVSSWSSRDSSAIFKSPKRSSLVTSTRPATPMNTKFGDEVLSPVVKEDSLPSGPINLMEDSCCVNGVCKGLLDAISNRVTLEMSNGYFRISLPEISESETVSNCLRALYCVLPKDIYSAIFVKWYCARNAPGSKDMMVESELNAFLTCLLGFIGYNTENICLGGVTHPDTCTNNSSKKQKLSENGSNEDYAYFQSSDLHKFVTKSMWENQTVVPSHGGGGDVTMSNSTKENFMAKNNTLLFPYVGHVLFSLHLVYENCKLNISQATHLPQLVSFLFELARDCRQDRYVEHYWRDYPNLIGLASLNIQIQDDQFKKICFPNFFYEIPPCIYTWIQNRFTCGDPQPFPYIPGATNLLRNMVLFYVILTVPDISIHEAESYLVRVLTGMRVHEEDITMSLTNYFQPSDDPKKTALLFLSKLGLTHHDVNTLPVGISLAIHQSILQYRINPPPDWQVDAYRLIGREDLASLHLTEKAKKPIEIPRFKSSVEAMKQSLLKECDDSFNHLDFDVIMLRFSNDLRISDVCNMLQSSKPVRVALQQRPNVSDHEFIEEQERHLYSLCIRTMALPVGRGMLTLQSYCPVVTEILPIPKLCLTGKAPPRNSTVDLTHIDVPPNMNMWPLFHNGVAAGLQISPNASEIDSTWMVYNKPRTSSSDTPTEHAGFLMALGLNGHLSNLSNMSIHDYLSKGHELTSVGILLGVSAAKKSTMDLSITKLLSIHIEALLPPTSTELDVPPVVQVAAVMGIGLLYQGSGHQRMAEVMLGEIGRPPGPEMEHCVDRESYSLAAGLSLGLITFGKGEEMSIFTDSMADQLYHYMVGGHKRPLTGVHKEKHKSPSYQIREGDLVNVDVTSPGATLALGMMFFDSNSQSIANWMAIPDTQCLLDTVRPDFLLIRMISKGLIMWSSVHPSKEWVESHVPEIVQKHAFNRGITQGDVDYETMSQAYCNIIAGNCMCLGLKFAGSANEDAFDTLLSYAKFFLSLTRKTAAEQAGRSTIETCLNVSTIALAMVMAGTGDLDVLRLCRHLRSRVSQASTYVLYGSHIATHMALGLLFLGGGRFTLTTSPLAVGSLLCAFYPKFPTHSNDNRYHLQALYHLYVLAIEPRLIVPRQLNAHHPIYAHVHIVFKDSLHYENAEYSVKAPCVLPELKFLKTITIEDSRYWPIVFDCDKNWDVLRKLLGGGGNLYLKQKSDCLPHNDDTKGFRSRIALSHIRDRVHKQDIEVHPDTKFSSDPLALHFAKYFIQTTTVKNKENLLKQKMCSDLFDCSSNEKLDYLPIYMSLEELGSSLVPSFNVWQIKLLQTYHNYYKTSSKDKSGFLLQSDFFHRLCRDMEFALKNRVHEDLRYLKLYFDEKTNFLSLLQNGFPASLCNFLIYFNVTRSKFNKPSIATTEMCNDFSKYMPEFQVISLSCCLMSDDHNHDYL